MNIMQTYAYGFFLALMGLLAVTPCASHANDSTAWISTGGVHYLKSRDIHMASEDLFISMDKIRVQYEFINHSRRTISETVVFPLPALRTGMDEDFADVARLHDSFKIWVNGKPVLPQKNLRVLWGEKDITDAFKRTCQLSEAVIVAPYGDGRDDAYFDQHIEPCLQSLTQQKVITYQRDDESEHSIRSWNAKMIYSWQQTFPAKSSLRVTHEYAPLVGGAVLLPRSDNEGLREFKRNYCIDGNFMNKLGKRPASYSALGYILTTGANWAKPIERFHLSIEKPKDHLLSVCWDQSLKKISDTRFEAHKTHFTPKQDLEVLFVLPYKD